AWRGQTCCAGNGAGEQMSAAEMSAARHGDLLFMFGKMLENDRAGGKPLVNKPLVKQPGKSPLEGYITRQITASRRRQYVIGGGPGHCARPASGRPAGLPKAAGKSRTNRRNSPCWCFAAPLRCARRKPSDRRPRRRSGRRLQLWA